VEFPVLISNKVNIWREIESDGAGLVADDTASGTAQLLQKWLALSPEEKHAMGQKAKQCFEERFEIEHVAQSLINTLRAHGVGG
jgi:glycosyltransferase involved in cell wall biosynthesis